MHERAFAELFPRATVLPIGLDRSDPLPRAQAKQMLGLRQDRLVVLCFGFIAPYKGLEAVLEAAGLAGPSVELVVAGGEHPRLAGKDPYASDLRGRYAGSARFTGYVDDEDVTTWFSAADVVLVQYPRPFSSSGPLALALGHGTPVLCSPPLASSIGAPEEMTAPLDPLGLARRLTELATDPVQLERLHSCAVAMASDRTWDVVAKRHVALYEKVISSTTRGTSYQSSKLHR